MVRWRGWYGDIGDSANGGWHERLSLEVIGGDGDQLGSDPVINQVRASPTASTTFRIAWLDTIASRSSSISDACVAPGSTVCTPRVESLAISSCSGNQPSC